MWNRRKARKKKQEQKQQQQIQEKAAECTPVLSEQQGDSKQENVLTLKGDDVTSDPSSSLGNNIQTVSDPMPSETIEGMEVNEEEVIDRKEPTTKKSENSQLPTMPGILDSLLITDRDICEIKEHSAKVMSDIVSGKIPSSPSSSTSNKSNDSNHRRVNISSFDDFCDVVCGTIDPSYSTKMKPIFYRDENTRSPYDLYNYDYNQFDGMRGIDNSNNDENENIEKHRHRYEWPNMYHEVREMMDTCLLIYPMSELRKLVWNGKADLKGNAEIVNMIPIESKKAMEVVQQNQLQIMNAIAVVEASSSSCPGGSSANNNENIQLISRKTLQNSKDRHQQQKQQNTDRNYNYAACNETSTETGGETKTNNTDFSLNVGAITQSGLQSTSQILHFEDGIREELVYSIDVNESRKRITVCFRGSRTMDWVTGCEVYMKNIANPLYKASDCKQPKYSNNNNNNEHSQEQGNEEGKPQPNNSEIGIHNAFYDYLFSPSNRQTLNIGGRSSNFNVNEDPFFNFTVKKTQSRQHACNNIADSDAAANDKNANNFTEYHAIHNQLSTIVQQYPNCKIYVTGHSLGGALATLFAFMIASEEDNDCNFTALPKPITCVSIGSPCVGDQSFRIAHQSLEGLGKLRHLRVTNHQDLVTMSPTMSFGFWNSDFNNALKNNGSIFKTVGMTLKLYPNPNPKVPQQNYYSGFNGNEIKEGQQLSENFEVSYAKVRTGYFTTHLEELCRGVGHSPVTNLSWNPKDYWTWSWHSMEEYNSRLVGNEILLGKLYLNDLYAREDIVGKLIPQC